MENSAENRKKPWPAQTVAVALIGSFLAVGNLAIAPMMRRTQPHQPEAIVVFVCSGAVIAQAGLLATWHTLFPGRLLKRTLATVGVGGLLLVPWMLGGLFDPAYPPRNYMIRDLAALFACVPLVILAIELPLWVLRIWAGWTAQIPGGRPQRSRFTIQQAIVLTGVTAVAFALARLSELDWGNIGIVAGCLAGLSLVVLVPMIWMALRLQRTWVANVCVMLYVVPVTIASTATFLKPGPPLAAVLPFSFGVVCGGSLMVARRLGYRLVHERDAEPAATAVEEPPDAS